MLGDCWLGLELVGSIFELPSKESGWLIWFMFALGSKGIGWWRFGRCMFETESEESGRGRLVAWFVPSMADRGGEW